jgi:hypothetical protein
VCDGKRIEVSAGGGDGSDGARNESVFIPPIENVIHLVSLQVRHIPSSLFSLPFTQLLLISFYFQDSTFDIATGYRLDDRGIGVRVPTG